MIPSINAHYGIRFRFWVYYESATLNEMSFYINGNLHQYSLDRNLPEDTSNTWIITTDLINYTDTNVILTFTRTDSRSFWDVTGLTDLMIIIAECVEHCLSCTSLNDCSACAPGYYLNGITHLCMSDCGAGMFASGSKCLFCD